MTAKSPDLERIRDALDVIADHLERIADALGNIAHTVPEDTKAKQ